jgi:hypothetical protein
LRAHQSCSTARGWFRRKPEKTGDQEGLKLSSTAGRSCDKEANLTVCKRSRRL